MNGFKIPVYKPALNGNEKKYVNECIDSTWISSKGSFIEKFEKQFSGYIGIKNSITVCNGTVALHLALLALGIGEGDEVIVPTLTYIASVNAIRYVGATPVFVDSEQLTWQPNVVDIVSKITPKTKAILTVHLYGGASDVKKIKSICLKHKIFLIEDCAEALGTKVDNIHVGNFGDISTFSFFGNKTITTGEGGMVVTNCHNLNNKIRHLKGQGLAKNREYWHDIIGYNYRMTNICAAIGLAQLENIHLILEKKKLIHEYYKVNLKLNNIIFQEDIPNSINSHWMCSIRLEDSKQRDLLRDYLTKFGIETRPLFYPVHLMPMYNNNQIFPTAECIGISGINLPSYPDLTFAELDFIIQNILNFFR